MKTPGSVRVLIVDDLAFMRGLLREVLEQEGFVVCAEAHNGREAIAQFEASKPDVVLLDITMPEMDGISALKRIKSIDPASTIIMCSAINEQEMILKAIALGAHDYVVKPFRPHRVVRALRKAIGLDAA